jgi:glycerophosphoryl diester phosphodiesterase
MSRPLLLGHRGARSLKSIPENTPASFDRALGEGCDGFEFDVRLTGDGSAVIYHDARAGRTQIAGASTEQLKDLPKLEQVLRRYQNRAFLDIELKVAGLEQITLALLRRHPPKRGFVVSSFLPGVLQSLHAADARLPIGLICEKRIQLSRWKELPISHVIAHSKLLNAALVRELKTAGQRVFVWTVNAAAEMRRFAELGVDGIISDKTELLCRTLGT